ncbi:DUF881 domain-containing protein [Heliorestis convoluta]|uniref:DUF881 domain-containing protein n=1 Tax=Heliorestis convoluta TaxID=356322 RepID=A0A5Q2N074_9FIRM|nr:DUF881 domain-containing protein [Heliorestis convoluta]QGG46916.1 hypothetical protein FTV88_0738 [Heliorestis convoluta]
MKMSVKMKWKRWQVAATIVALTLGILLTTQFNTATQLAQGRTELIERQKALEELLEKGESERMELEEEISRLKAEVEKYEAVAKGYVGTGISTEIDRLRILTGYASVEGAGIRVTLDTKQATLFPLDIIDLMELVNILRYAGAEAIAVNGQRIIANSEIYVSGKNILINKTPISSDRDQIYVIDAIGPPDQLSDVLQVTDGLVNSLKERKIDIRIAKQNTVEIPAYAGSFRFRYAKPLTQTP